MKRLGQITIAGIAQLRAVIAVVFLVLSSLQPSLFASANASGFHGDYGATLLVEKSHHDNAGHAGDHGSAVESDADEKHSDGEKSAGDDCEVHCAPAHAVPVECPGIVGGASRCFAVSVVTVLPLGAYSTLIRPPKHI
ncbi:MAG: hypothetical protein EOQ57_16655 [Mesorhizobium sp.]|uniref:hypothetical protein n=1 Tax=Mesorhizobium sp. TaxID=1871066 RepID=UPI000FE6E313|nr:hypothetical protein [Mesorhizobium sp.]RWC00244.1 MAG: hypothetical protein EOQ57_16655 [Mesorhizobium sp.]